MVSMAEAVVIGTVFITDFGFDDDAAEWLALQYLENNVEGEKFDVAWPKHRRVRNREWAEVAPIFVIALLRVTLHRGKKLDTYSP